MICFVDWGGGGSLCSGIFSKLYGCLSHSKRHYHGRGQSVGWGRSWWMVGLLSLCSVNRTGSVFVCKVLLIQGRQYLPMEGIKKKKEI